MKIIINQDQVNSVIQQLKNNLKLRDSYMLEGTKFEENARIFNRCWHECKSRDLKEIMFNKTQNELDNAIAIYKKVKLIDFSLFILTDFCCKEISITERTFEIIDKKVNYESLSEDEKENAYNQVESTLSYAGIECGEFLQEFAKILNIKLVA